MGKIPETNSAIQKALSVLEVVAQEIRPLSVVDISAELGLPRQTVHRVIRQLEELDLLRKDPSRERYHIGERLLALALCTISSSQNTRRTHGILQGLVEEVKETCNIGMLDGHQIIYIDRVECDWPLRVQLKAGSHVPVHCTAIGKLLLAYQDKDAQDRLLRTSNLQKFTKYTITQPEHLEAQLDQIVAQGYSINNQEDAIGLIAMAVPVRDPQGDVVAGLAVHAPEPRFSIAKAIKQLPLFRQAAERIGQAMFESD
ncbi:MAG: IclR family transcriptional regulator [Proteobacteria bacterium]|nr:IclR family transcriptional regulator [Pseudomonadota bacterium]